MIKEIYQRLERENPGKDVSALEMMLSGEVNLLLQEIDQDYLEKEEQMALGIIEGKQVDIDTWRAAEKRKILSEYLSFFDDKYERGQGIINMSFFALEGADLTRLDFSYVNLTEADLRNANARESNFSYAKCEEIDISGANLEHTSLVGTDFTALMVDQQTKLHQVDIRKSNLAEHVKESFLTHIIPTESIHDYTEFLDLMLQANSYEELVLLSRSVAGDVTGVNAQDEEGNTPPIRMIKLLLSYDGPLNIQHVSIENQFKEAMLKMVSDPSFDPSLTDERGRNLFHYLIRYMDPVVTAEVVKQCPALMEHINHQDHYGQTPLLYGMQRGYIQEMDIGQMASFGADFSLQDKFGYTALMYAARRGSERVVARAVELQQKHGVDLGIEKRNVFNQSAWDITHAVSSNLPRYAPLIATKKRNPANSTVRHAKARLVEPYIQHGSLDPDHIKMMLVRLNHEAGNRQGSQVFFVDYEQDFAAMLPKLKQVIENRKGREYHFEFLVGIGIGHYGSIIMDIDKNGQMKLTLYDTLGIKECKRKESLFSYMEEVFKHFPNATFYANSEKIQRDYASCHVISYQRIKHVAKDRKQVSYDTDAAPFYAYLDANTVPEAELETFRKEIGKFQKEVDQAFDKLEEGKKQGMDIRIVRPYGFPPRMYKYAQYLGPIKAGQVAEEDPVIGKKGEKHLKEAVEEKATYRVKYGKPVSKARRDRTDKLAEQLVIFVQGKTSSRLEMMLEEVDVKVGMHNFLDNELLIGKGKKVGHVTQEIKHVVPHEDVKIFKQKMFDWLRSHCNLGENVGNNQLQHTRIGRRKGQISPRMIRFAIRHATKECGLVNKCDPFDPERGIIGNALSKSRGRTAS